MLHNLQDYEQILDNKNASIVKYKVFFSRQVKLTSMEKLSEQFSGYII
jgi:hypothetical protein